MLKRTLGAVAALALTVMSASAVELAPAERFIDPVSAYSATLSPDGNFVALLRRTNTDQRVVIIDLATQQSRAIQAVSTQAGDLDWVVWKGSDRVVVSVSLHRSTGARTATGSVLSQSSQNYDITRIVAMNRDGSGVVQMFEGQLRSLLYGLGSTFLLDELPNDPTHVLLYAWDNNGTGAWLADVGTGRVERVADGEDLTWYYATDGNGVPVMRVDMLSDGSGQRIYRRAPGASTWTLVSQVRLAETATNSPDFQVLAAGPGAGQVYVLARPDNAEFLSLFLYNTATGELGQPVADPEHEGASPWFTRRTHEVMATCSFGQRMSCRARDPAMQRHLNALDAFFQHAATISLVDMSDDGGKWLVHVDGPTILGAYYIYEVAAHSVVAVANIHPNLDDSALSPTEVVDYQSRDGTALWSYVTAHAGAAGPRPMVVMPHGGPEFRDMYGYDPFVQFLASRGYIVLQPNFRGGAGFGRSFADAGRGQWGLRMQDDVTDAVRHMIQTGAADPRRICIVGYSYGGYVALEGVSSTPELYRCAISIAGVSDLQLSLNREGPHWGTNYQYWLRSIGTDRAAIAEHSPRLHADRISAPVLLIHGEEDTTVPIRQSELMGQALNNAGHRTRLVRIPDETHYWNDWSNDHRLTVLREIDQFLAQNLGPVQ